MFKKNIFIFLISTIILPTSAQKKETFHSNKKIASEGKMRKGVMVKYYFDESIVKKNNTTLNIIEGK